MGRFGLSQLEFGSIGDFLELEPLTLRGVRLLLLEHEECAEDVVLLSLFPWTSQDLERMASFTRREAKTSWCFSRFLSRHALAWATNMKATGILLGYGLSGKPFLPGYELRFSWSHTPGCVVLALSTSGEVGCDVEDSRQLPTNFCQVARAVFSTAEREWLAGASDVRRRWDRFLAIFTQKEARLKFSGHAHGERLSAIGAILKQPPFHERSITCFQHGEDNRYVVALCSSAILEPGPIVGALRFEAGRLFQATDWSLLPSSKKLTRRGEKHDRT